METENIYSSRHIDDQMAREVDPNGVRTLGVVTKIDMMDQDTNALKMLRGEVLPLQLGHVGVMNRSQKDINNSKPTHDAQTAERLFFKSHAAYRSILRCLPELEQSIHDNVNDLKHEIVSYGRPISLDNNLNQNKGALLLHRRRQRQQHDAEQGQAQAAAQQLGRLGAR